MAEEEKQKEEEEESTHLLALMRTMCHQSFESHLAPRRLPHHLPLLLLHCNIHTFLINVNLLYFLRFLLYLEAHDLVQVQM